MLDGSKHKIYRSQKFLEQHNHTAGSIATDGKKFLRIACKEGWIEILTIQADKRKRMDIKSFLNGYHIQNHSIG